MARIIVITSGKGGVGKTTVAVHLSLALAKKGESVVLCDGDFGLNNADILLGLENHILYDIVDVIEGRCRVKQALVRSKQCGNLHLLSSSHSAPERYISPQALKVVLSSLSPLYDYVIVDCPAGIDEGFHRVVSCVDEAIVVATPTLSSVRDADKVVTMLKSYALKKISLLVNRVKNENLTAKEMEALLKTPLIGVLPEMDELDCEQGYIPFKMLANNVKGGKVKLFDPCKKKRKLDFWRKFFLGE